MKKSLIFAVAAVVLSACATKENPYTSELVPERTPDGKILIYATMPEFEAADASKAAISDAGVFSWTVGDKIDVVFSNGVTTEPHTFECTNASTGAFSCGDAVTDGFSVSGAYYPTGYDGTPYNQNFASLADAAKGFQMHATVSAGKLAFVHDNAMFAVQVQNVPMFAKTVWVNDASVDITSESGNVDVRIPVIPAASAKLNIKVTDAEWSSSYNEIISKDSEKETAIVAKKFYFLNNLVITPEVHFLSAATGWSVVDGNIIDPVANVSTKTRFAVVGGEEWFRYTVKYGSFEVTYGYTAGTDYNNSVPFLPQETEGARISTSGLYSIAFNVLTGSYTVTRTSDVAFRLLGIDSKWDITNPSEDHPLLTNLIGKVYVWKGTSSNGEFKVCLDGENSWSSPYIYGAANSGWWTDNMYTGGSAQNAGLPGDSSEAVVSLDFGSNPWIISSERVSAAASSVKIRGSFNSEDWNNTDGIALIQHPTYPTYYYTATDLEVASAGEMKFVENNTSWYGGYDKSYDIGGTPSYKLAQKKSDDSDAYNLTIPTGTFTIYYNSISHAYTAIKK